jgi:hypothetical protein
MSNTLERLTTPTYTPKPGYYDNGAGRQRFYTAQELQRQQVPQQEYLANFQTGEIFRDTTPNAVRGLMSKWSANKTGLKGLVAENDAFQELMKIDPKAAYKLVDTEGYDEFEKGLQSVYKPESVGFVRGLLGPNGKAMYGGDYANSANGSGSPLANASGLGGWMARGFGANAQPTFAQRVQQAGLKPNTPAYQQAVQQQNRQTINNWASQPNAWNLYNPNQKQQQQSPAAAWQQKKQERIMRGSSK